MGIWQKIKSRVRDWVGGGSPKKKKKTPPSPRVIETNRDARNQTISSRSGGGGRILIDVDDKKESERIKKAFKASGSDSSSSGTSSSNPFKATELQKKAREDYTRDIELKNREARKARLKKRQEKFNEREAERARKEQKKAKREAEIASFHTATQHRYDTEHGTKEERKAAQQRVKSGDVASDPKTAMWEFETHPVATMMGRTAANSMGAGVPDAIIKRLGQSEEQREVEDTYRRIQEEHPWARGAAELAGALVPYGGTARAFEGLGARAIGRAAETQIGRKLGAEALGRIMAGEGTKAAIARSLVGDAIQDSTLGLVDTLARTSTRDDLETSGDYAKAIAEGQALNYGMGLLGNAVSHGLPVAGRAVRNAWGDFADESRRLHFTPNERGLGALFELDETPQRNLVMNGGTTRASRLQGVGYEAGMKPKKLGNKVTPPKPEVRANVPNSEPATIRKPSEILQGYSSKGSKKKFDDARKTIGQHIANGDEKAAREEMARAVDDIVRDTKTVVPMDDTIKEIKDELKNTRISISSKAKTDAGYKSGGYGELRKKNFGSFKLTKDGTPVDDLWLSLQERYGTSLFPDEIDTESEQLLYLADIAKTTDDEIDLFDDEAEYLKDELSRSLWASANEDAKRAPRGKAATAEAVAENADGEVAETVTKNTESVAKSEPPRERARKPSKSETRLEEVKKELKEARAEYERLKAEGVPSVDLAEGDASATLRAMEARDALAETLRKYNNLEKEQAKLEKNIKRAAKERQKRADKRFLEESWAEKEAEKTAKAEAKAEAKVEKAAANDPDSLARNFEEANPGETEKLKEIYPEVKIKRIFAEDKKQKILFGENEYGELFVGDPWSGFGAGAHRDPARGFEGGFYKAKDFERARKDYEEVLLGKMPKEAKSKAKGGKAKTTTPKADVEVETKVVTEEKAPDVKPDTKAEKVTAKAEKTKAKKGAKKAAEKLNAKAKSEATKAEAKPEPQVEVVAKGEEAKAGEQTEFRRSEETTAKEKARNKRTSENRAKATQEDFDRDFAEFEKKVSENREKVSQLNGRLRAATTDEEKQAIRDEIRALDEEIKRMHRKASLKYHPDRGGSTEWAQKFNGAYDNYKKRVYSSPNFSGASSKGSGSGARNNTYREYRRNYKTADAGAGGNTPPPPRGGKYADYDGLRRPKGYAKRTQRAMHSVEDMVGATKEGKSARETFRQFRDEADRKFVDSMKDFEGVARERKKTLGKEAMAKLYGAIDKARRYRAIATSSVGSHQMKWDGTRYQVKGADGVMRDAPSIAEIFSGMDKETEKSFNAYLLLKHNIDRLREGKPVFDNTVIYNEELSRRLGLPKDIDLMDADICKRLAEDYEARFSDFQDRAAMIRQYTANELNNRVQAGLLSRETMDEWLHKYPNYVPTYREGLFDGIAAAKGGTVRPSDLKAAKGSDLNIYDIKEQLSDATVRNWRDMTLNNLLAKTFGENIAKLADSAEVSPYRFALDHTMNVSKSADGGKYYADVYIDGEAKRIEIAKRFYDDIEDLYKNGRFGNGLDGFNDKVLVPLANTWKKLITEWSPIFMVKNAMRDFPEAIINSRNRKEFLAIAADRSALKDLLNNGKFSQSLRDAGISASTFIDVDKAVKAFEKGEGGLKTLIPRLNAGVEMYPRLVEYMATIKKAGYDLKTVNIEDIPMSIRDMAAANAADVTVNFGRSGSVGKMLNKGAIPFFNPSIQGWSKFARNITELDGMKDTLSFLATATALGTAPMVATNLLYQHNPNYQRISARDKASNYIIALPPYDDNADTFLKIPRSRFASVYGLPLVNVANENKASWAEVIQIVNDQVAPLNPIESHLGANLIQAARNKTWYGTPIESEAMQSLPANERYDATTSGISIGAAKALNKVSKGKVKVSPKKLDYVLDANLGVVADFGLPLTTQANKGVGIPSRVANVGKKAFTVDSVTQSDLSSRYYDKGTLLEQSKNSAEASEKDKTAYKKFSSWDKRVKSVTGAMRYVQASDMPNKQEAYRELAKLRNDNMQKALDGKTSINNARDIDVIHKYAGTSYTIENLGKSADQKALKTYAAAVYGDLSEDEMRKKIDSDTEFYRGYKGIAKTQSALQKVSPSLKGNNALTYAVGLADADANDDTFAAYNTTIKSRTESASKAQRAKDYLSNGGSVQEFAQLENAVKGLGKLSDVDKGKLEDEAYEKLERGEMSIDEYNTELKKIDYNANQSYVGKSVSLALSSAPSRAYTLYDIKPRNIQKGINLAAMGIDSRQYREMSQACDTDGNGYLKTAEIKNYVANSDVEDKATLFDALCYYPNVRNPFGTPNKYSSEQAAQVGKERDITAITSDRGDFNFKDEGKTSKSGYGGYRRRGYGGYRRRRGGSGGSSKTPALKQSAFKASTYKAAATTLPRTGSYSVGASKKTSSAASKVKVEPPKVKFKKYEV